MIESPPRLKRQVLIVALSLIVFMQSGCSTMLVHSDIEDVGAGEDACLDEMHVRSMYAYGGTITNVAIGRIVIGELFRHPDTAMLNLTIGMLVLIDLPLSFAFDTVLLPAAITRDLLRHRRCEP